MTICVQPLSATDRRDWETLYKKYAAFYGVPMEQQTLNTVWEWIFNEHEPFYAQIAKTDTDKAIGIMHYRAMRSPLRGITIGFLDDLYVSEEARGTGAVDALFAALETAGKEFEWPVIRWITAEDNYRARAVYERLGERTEWKTYQLRLVNP